MTDKEKLESLWEQVLKLKMFINAMKLLMDEEKNTLNIKECIDKINIKISLMTNTLEKEKTN